MVRIGEALDLIRRREVNGLSNVGVEVLSNGHTVGLIGTYLASDIRPEDGAVVVEVYVKNGNSEESDTAFSDGLLEVMGENGIDENSKVLVWFVDYESRTVTQKFDAEAVWANTERDEVTFTVRQYYA